MNAIASVKETDCNYLQWKINGRENDILHGNEREDNAARSSQETTHNRSNSEVGRGCRLANNLEYKHLILIISEHNREPMRWQMMKMR